MAYKLLFAGYSAKLWVRCSSFQVQQFAECEQSSSILTTTSERKTSPKYCSLSRISLNSHRLNLESPVLYSHDTLRPLEG